MTTQIMKDDIAIYIIDDDKDIRVNTTDLLSTEFKHIESFESPQKVLEKISRNLAAIIVTDLRMPNADGLDYAIKMLEIDAQLPIILMTGYGDISVAVEAMRNGIYDFIEKPFNTNHLIETIHRAVEKRFLTLSLAHTRDQLDNRDHIEQTIIGLSPSIQQLRQDILDLAPLDIPVMIYGETGAGKELAARCLHEYSKRSNGRFVALNCAAIPEQLAEAELFGNVKGAFTDAYTARTGKLEYANNGTLFLDEIESLSPSIQAKLLRALSDNLITPLGSNQEIPINCRIVSGSKIDLRNQENFRQDLFFRLEVASVTVPPIRKREEDIIMLFEYFSSQNCERLGTTYQPTNDYAQKRLVTYSWPGNVRELINASTRFAIKHCSDIDYAIDSSDIVVKPSTDNLTLKEQVEHYEASLIKLKLDEHKGKVSKVLEDLSVERRTFNQKLIKYGITTSDFKPKKS